MHLNIVATALVIVAPVLAEELRANDVPPACTVICKPIVSLTNTCDIDPLEKGRDHDKRQVLSNRQESKDDEPVEAACICQNKSFNVATVMGLCASCIAQNGNKTRDVAKIMSQCSFLPVSYSPSSTGVVSGIQVAATKPVAANLTQPSSTRTVPKTSSAGKMANSLVLFTGVVLAAIAAGLD